MKRILALDLAAKSGFAIQRADGEVVTGVHICLKTSVAGNRWIRFNEWLVGMIDFEDPQLIIFEEPFIHMKHRSGIGLSYGFKTLVELQAAGQKIRCCSIAPTVLKQFATGHGNASKEQMLIFARSMGWDLSDDNEIDARFLLFYAQERIRKAKGAA